jgi:hypothetical protein
LVEQRYWQGGTGKIKRRGNFTKLEVRKEGATIWEKLLRSRDKEGCL